MATKSKAVEKKVKPAWGGKRPGSGRKRRDTRPGPAMSHLARTVERKFPLSVTVHVREGVGKLRSPRLLPAVEEALLAGNDRFGFSLVQFGVLDDRIHLLVEADDKAALKRGMQGLSVRLARRLNRELERRGSVMYDRYQSTVLRTAAEVKSARRELGEAQAVAAPRTALLKSRD